jgi:hypothetical protein
MRKISLISWERKNSFTHARQEEGYQRPSELLLAFHFPILESNHTHGMHVGRLRALNFHTDFRLSISFTGSRCFRISYVLELPAVNVANVDHTPPEETMGRGLGTGGGISCITRGMRTDFCFNHACLLVLSCHLPCLVSLSASHGRSASVG